MGIKQIISLWALVALLLGQVALAQHNVTHSDHGFFQESAVSHSDHDHQGDDHEKKKHNCPECVLTKSLQTAFYHAPSFLIGDAEFQKVVFTQYSFAPHKTSSKANSPRAPPVFLI